MSSDSETAAAPSTMEARAAVRPDLDSRAKVHDLVVDFYREIAFDDLLGPVFGEVAEVDWATHIPKLIDYWCRVLLGHPGYDGYVVAAHRPVHELEPLTSVLFDRWYRLFVEAVDRGWQGSTAERAKTHAAKIAGALARRLSGIEWTVPARCPEQFRADLVAEADVPTGWAAE